jgi:5-methylcytosine-specific restriction protein A
MTVAKIQGRKFGKKEHYGSNWKALSKEVRQNNSWRCAKCFKSFKEDKARLHADHILPLSVGGSNSLANLQSLCYECHQAKHRRKF